VFVGNAYLPGAQNALHALTGLFYRSQISSEDELKSVGAGTSLQRRFSIHCQITQTNNIREETAVWARSRSGSDFCEGSFGLGLVRGPR